MVRYRPVGHHIWVIALAGVPIFLILAAGRFWGPADPDLVVADFLREQGADPRSSDIALECLRSDSSITIRGHVTSLPELTLLEAQLRRAGLGRGRTSLQVTALPELLGPRHWGLITDTLAPLGEAPGRYSGDSLLTEALFATPVLLLGEVGSAYRLQLPDGYIGYMDRSHLFRCSQPELLAYWSPAREPVVLLRDCRLPPTDQPVLRGTRLSLLRREAEGVMVLLPGGEECYLPSAWVAGGRWVPDAQRRELPRLARRFLGVPYLWGGTTPTGVDCSGLVQRLYGMVGLHIPRDCDQQYEAASPLDEGTPLLPGDLLFFRTVGDRVSHVGMVIDEDDFIHASRDGVKVNSLQPSRPCYSGYLASALVRAGRFIGVGGKPALPPWVPRGYQ